MSLMLTLAIIYIILILALAFIFLLVSQPKLAILKKLHRENKIGGVILVIAMFWAGYQGYILFGQDFPIIASILPIAVPVSTMAALFLMDYIFTRAIGGIIILLTCELFFLSQINDMSFRFFFAIVGYSYAIIGMYMIGQPWHFRDLLLKSAENKAFGKKVFLIMLCSIIVMFIPFFTLYV